MCQIQRNFSYQCVILNSAIGTIFPVLVGYCHTNCCFQVQMFSSKRGYLFVFNCVRENEFIYFLKVGLFE